MADGEVDDPDGKLDDSDGDFDNLNEDFDNLNEDFDNLPDTLDNAFDTPSTTPSTTSPTPSTTSSTTSTTPPGNPRFGKAKTTNIAIRTKMLFCGMKTMFFIRESCPRVFYGTAKVCVLFNRYQASETRGRSMDTSSVGYGKTKEILY